MELTLFIKKSGNPIANCAKTSRSFRHEDVDLKEIIFIDKLGDIVYEKIKTEWFVVFYDDEYIEPNLLSSMLIGSKCENYDVFSFYKMDYDTKVTICPRMFRKEVRLDKDHLYPIPPVRMEVLLDGWVFSQRKCDE